MFTPLFKARCESAFFEWFRVIVYWLTISGILNHQVSPLSRASACNEGDKRFLAPTTVEDSIVLYQSPLDFVVLRLEKLRQSCQL